MCSIDKIKLTSHQIFALSTGFSCGSSILVISATAASYAKQDAWISSLISLLLGLLELWLIFFLWSKYPGLTFAEMIKAIFGKWIGSIIIFCFIFFCFVSGTQIIWYVQNFLTIHVLIKTPPYMINTLFISVIAIALLYGIEAIGRSYEILIYIAAFLFIFAMLLLLPNVSIENLQPVLENGFSPIIKASLLLSTFTCMPLVLFLTIYPSVADYTKKARNCLIKGYLLGGSLVFISILFSLLVLGSTITAVSQYPVYILAKEINVGHIITRFEFVVAGVWIITLLTRGIIYFYGAASSLSTLVKLKDHKVTILPLALNILVFSGIIYSDVFQLSEWDTFVWPLYVATYGVLLPLIMLVTTYVKQWFKKHN